MTARARHTPLLLLLALALLACEDEKDKAREAVELAIPLMERSPAEAATRLEWATRLDPTSVEAFRRLAEVRLAQGGFAAAAAAAEHANTLEESAEHHELVGHARAGLAEWEPALAAYDRALALDPERRKLEIERGRLLERLGRGDEAEAAYRRALDAGVRAVEARIGLAGRLIARGERAEARALLASAREGVGDDAELAARIDALTGEAAEPEAPTPSDADAGAAPEEGGAQAESPFGSFTGAAAGIGESFGVGGLGMVGVGMPNTGPSYDVYGGLGQSPIGYGGGGREGAEAATTAAVHLDIEPPTIRGDLSVSVVERVLSRGGGALERCVDDGRAGHVSTRYVVTNTGTVPSAAVVNTDLPERVRRCVLDRLRRLRFPPSQMEGVAIVEQTFRYRR